MQEKKQDGEFMNLTTKFFELFTEVLKATLTNSENPVFALPNIKVSVSIHVISPE